MSSRDRHKRASRAMRQMRIRRRQRRRALWTSMAAVAVLLAAATAGVLV